MSRHVFLFAGLFLVASGTSLGQADKPLTVGVTKTFFNDMSKPLAEVTMEPFAKVMQDATGLKGKTVLGGDAFAVAKELEDGKIQLGVFHSFEFAWVHQKYPNFKAHMQAVEQHPKAFVIVHKDSPAAKVADLKGKTLSYAKKTKQHCVVFLDRLARQNGAPTKDFFGKTVVSPNVEEALDEVSFKTTDATVVDNLSFTTYKNIKPGAAKRLKILEESINFPSAVVAYKEGALDKDTLSQVRDGLLKAPNTQAGKDLLKDWKIEAFADIPAGYAKTEADLLKAFPPPEMPAKTSRLDPGLSLGLAALVQEDRDDPKTAAPRRRNGDPGIVRAAGTVEPVEVIDVCSHVSGTILKFGPDSKDPTKTIDHGSEVEAGSVLAQLEPALFKNRLDEQKVRLLIAKAQVQIKEARLQLTERDWKRHQQLAAQKAVSLEELDQAHARFDEARGDVELAKAQFDLAKVQVQIAEIDLDFTTIRSPIKGVIIERRAQVGQTVLANPNSSMLFQVAKDLKRLQIVAWVVEGDIGRIKTGQKARFTVAAFPQETFTGKVVQVRLNASAKAFPVLVQVDDIRGKLLPSLTAQVEFLVGGN